MSKYVKQLTSLVAMVLMMFVFALLVLALQKILMNFKEDISIHSLAPIVEYIGEPL